MAQNYNSAKNSTPLKKKCKNTKNKPKKKAKSAHAIPFLPTYVHSQVALFFLLFIFHIY